MKMIETHTILLTAAPRSGSTLICKLLNQLPNVVILDQPLSGDKIVRLRGDDFLYAFNHKLADFRTMIHTEKKIVSVQTGNQFLQHYANEKDEKGLRKRVVKRGITKIDKYLADDFVMILKSHFLEELQNTEGKVARIIKVISTFFEKMYPLLEDGHVIYYEDLIATQGQILEMVIPQAKNITEILTNQNSNPLYDHAIMKLLGQQLLNSEGAFWDFYSKEHVEALIESLDICEHKI
ncbi:MAG: hypothetical protein B6242_17065 [Anaerolineaceae bacterium 4572_78]|nr:MAG: hypothetical protein B6242_17065 [Anaerolineaceae bacterium 4572_78]